MRIAVMQPYFFPYLGYFQLMRAVDTFVFYDDVNFISRGYVNRNSVLGANGEQRITLELIGASQNKLIKDIRVGGNRAKLLKTLQMLYGKAPHASRIMPLLEASLTKTDDNLASFLIDDLKAVAAELGQEPTFLLSSDIDKDDSLRGQDKILAICSALGATGYINPVGGKELYDPATFKQRGIELLFHNFVPRDYMVTDRKRSYLPYLSVIDFLMWVDPAGRAPHLASYELSP